MSSKSDSIAGRCGAGRSGTGVPSREVTDPKAMRALAHPVRLTLLEQLSIAGTLTAAQASELMDETPANCSFHLRTLAKYGFVERAEGGHGRERPWRRVPGRIGTTEVHDGSDASATARALTDVIVDRHLDTIATYRTEIHPGLPPEWQEPSGHSNVIVHVNLDEMHRLRADLLALLGQYGERSADTALRPPDSRPVQIFAFTMPMATPTDGPADTDRSDTR